MALNLSQKEEVVAELAAVARGALSLVAAEYAGLTVGQLTDLRKKARASGVYVKVAKNTLVSRAVEGTDYQCVQSALTGPLLYAFSKEDPGAAGRLAKDFAKANEKFKPRLVSIGGNQRKMGTWKAVMRSAVGVKRKRLKMMVTVPVKR